MIAAAQVDSPEVVAARFNEHVAAAIVREMLGRFLPTLDLEASVGQRSATGLTEIQNSSTQINARRPVPLYQQGTVSCQARTGEVQIYGAVFGNVESNRRVEIYSTGRLRGDVRTPQMVIKEGGVFEGRSHGTSDVKPEEPAPDFASGQTTKTFPSAKTKKEGDWSDSFAP